MVIKALETKPCGDAISRKWTLDIVNNFVFDTETDRNRIIHIVRDTAPSVAPKQKWIPVSERLPEKDGEYLLYGKIEDDEENYIFLGDYDACAEEFGIWQEQFDRYSLGCLGSEFYEYNSVLAWMPLPEAYKEESEG